MSAGDFHRLGGFLPIFGWRRWWPLVVIAILTIAIGVYARYLNHLFYSAYGPFYDSLAYALIAAKAFTIARAQGLGACLSHAILSRNTVFLPWAEACLLSLVSDLRRDALVWLQLPWLFILGIAGYRYFARSAHPALALCLSLPLIAINAVFYFNGGLSDFRMDLFQYMLFGATCLQYLSIRSTERQDRYDWALLGVIAGLSCLARATSPVYLAMVFVPLLIVELMNKQANRKSILLSYGIAAATSMVVAAWFFIINVQYLYYYYFIWNSAANAHLPLGRSVKHLSLLFLQNIGQPLTLYLGFSLCLHLAWRIRVHAPLFSNLNWRALWCGVAPLSFLVLLGAGLNPFVSMVGAPGFIAFLQVPWTTAGSGRPRWLQAALMAGVLTACAATAAQGVANHSDPRYVSEWLPMAEAVSAVDRELTADIERRPAGHYRFSVVYVGSMNSEVILNSLLFDNGAAYVTDGTVSRGRWTLENLNAADNAVTEVEWNELPGKTEQEKISAVVRAILDQSDYILLPTPHSQLASNVFINSFAPRLSQELLSRGHLIALGLPILVMPHESVVWYHNARDKAPP